MNAPLRVPTRTRTLLISSSSYRIKIDVNSGPTPSSIDLQRPGVVIFPAPPYFAQQCLTALGHLLDHGTRRLCVLVPRSPNQQFQKQRRKINTFCGKPVIYPSPVATVHLGCDYSRGFKLLEAISEDVGSDVLARLRKLLESSKAANHQVANNQQRPAITQNLQRDAYWTSRAALGFRFARHRPDTLTKQTCGLQVMLNAVIRLGKLYWKLPVIVREPCLLAGGRDSRIRDSIRDHTLGSHSMVVCPFKKCRADH